MAEPTAQRAWRAACSSCGAPVEFRSAASPMAVCSFCRSTLVRDGDTLRRIGVSAELFDDHSPLQIGASGRYHGEPFTLVGRTQMAWEGGPSESGIWSEWHALFDNGRSGWLSEDNGSHVFSFEQNQGQLTPDLKDAHVGEPLIIDGQGWTVSALWTVRVHAMEGELPRSPDLTKSYRWIELRNPQDQVLSVDTSTQPPSRFVGVAVALPDLALRGLKTESSSADLKSKGHECPHCGAALNPTLDSTQSIACGACHSVVDISQGWGADLAYYKQDNGLEPLLPLGSTGVLKVDGVSDSWQVVGYLERCEQPSDPDDEVVFWREYLVYNRLRGFAFLVDSQEGWSVVRPITGVPKPQQGKLLYRDETYRQLYAYRAKTTYVLGEFYWRVARDQTSENTDYTGTGKASKKRINCERSGTEMVWSAGHLLDAAEVMQAFRIDAGQKARFKRDVGSLSSGSTWWWRLLKTQWFWWLVIILIIVMIESCSDDCGEVKDLYGSASTEYQQCRRASGSGSHGSSGGSWGGYSSGGFHK